MPFDDTNKEVYGKEKKIRGFNEAMLEIQTNPGLKVDSKRKENADNKLVVCILCDNICSCINRVLESKNLDQTISSDQPDQTCNHRILKDTRPFFSKIGNNTETNMFILKIQEIV